LAGAQNRAKRLDLPDWTSLGIRRDRRRMEIFADRAGQIASKNRAVTVNEVISWFLARSDTVGITSLTN
jgi:hypothetical protein